MRQQSNCVGKSRLISNKILNKGTLSSQQYLSKKKRQAQKNFPQRQSALPVIKINGEEKLSNTRKQHNESEGKQSQQMSRSCFKKTKTHQISKRKINFEINYSNFEKQYKKYGNLFINAMNKMTSNSTFLKSDKTDVTNKNFPITLLNVLYGQNIPNYNPYIEALDQLYDQFQGKINKQKMENIKKLCYIGIAKNYFKSQKYSETPKYRRVNILIRTYMYENMHNIVEQKAENYQNIVFIPCNKGALNFPYNNFPEELNEICSKDFYQNIVENVNKIIEKQYINYKKMNNKKTVTDRWCQNLVHFFTILFIIIFLLSNSVIFLYVMVFLMVISLILYIDECRQTLGRLGSSKNIIQKIQSSVECYLKEINTHNMQWKVGQDFYWLQIHYIRKKKKKHNKILH